MEIGIKVLVLGVFATAIIDIWATFSNRVLKFPRTNWAMVGRWLGHISKGKFIHNPVGSSSEIRFENTIGWAFHYLVGVTYAGIYVALLNWFLGNNGTLLTAWAFGLITILSPWLIMQPALGLGVCAVKASRPSVVRLQNFVIHSTFGVALYYGWLGINA